MEPSGVVPVELVPAEAGTTLAAPEMPAATYVVGAGFLAIAIGVPAFAFFYFHALFPFLLMLAPAWASLGYGILTYFPAVRTLAIGWLALALVATTTFLLFTFADDESELGPFVLLAIVVETWLYHFLCRPGVREAFATNSSFRRGLTPPSIDLAGAAFVFLSVIVPALAFLFAYDLFPFLAMAGPAWAAVGYGILLGSQAARTLAIGWLATALACTSAFLLLLLATSSDLVPAVVLTLVAGLWLLHVLRRAHQARAGDVPSVAVPAVVELVEAETESAEVVLSATFFRDGSPENPYTNE